MFLKIFILYIEAYLKREIKTCTDLVTPNLVLIENEMKQSLGTTKYSEDLKDINNKTIELLNQECNY